MKKYLTKSSQETMALGQKLAKQLESGAVVALSGNLGAGKTTLVKGLALGLGIKNTITSPTFVLMKIYPVKNPKTKIKQLVHIDCYRLNSAEELEAIGAEEYFNQPDTLTVVEWPEKINGLFSRQTKKIKLSSKQENIRLITIN